MSHSLSFKAHNANCGERYAVSNTFGSSCGGVDPIRWFFREVGELVWSSEEFEPRAIRGCFGEIVAVPDEDKYPLRSTLTAERLYECGLAYPGLATDEYETALPGERRGETLAQNA